MTTLFTTPLLDQAYTYDTYKQYTDHLLAQGRTTGPKAEDPALVHYTRLNAQRMERLDRTALLPELRQALTHHSTHGPAWRWVMLAEPWCGDVAQNLPTWAAAAQAANIPLAILLRDENPSIMDAFLTNGSRSIPKLICLDAHTLAVAGHWGPRPAVAQQLVMAYKANPTKPYAEFVEDIHRWYTQDKTQSLQQEILACIASWGSTAP